MHGCGYWHLYRSRGCPGSWPPSVGSEIIVTFWRAFLRRLLWATPALPVLMEKGHVGGTSLPPRQDKTPSGAHKQKKQLNPQWAEWQTYGGTPSTNIAWNCIVSGPSCGHPTNSSYCTDRMSAPYRCRPSANISINHVFLGPASAHGAIANIVVGPSPG